MSGAYRQATCTHCRQREPGVPCPSCRELVCAECAGDPGRCSLPAVRELRLGWGWRLRGVDPSGRFGVAHRLASSPRFVALDDGTWLDFEVRSLPPFCVLAEPVVLPSGFVVFELREASTSDSVRASRGLALYGPDGDLVVEIPTASGGQPLQLVAGGTHAWRTLSNEQVEIIELREPYRVHAITVMANRVIQSVAFDPITGILAAATWGELATYRVYESARRLCDRRVVASADIPWLGLAGRRLVAVVDRPESRGSEGDELFSFELDDDGRLREERRVPTPRFAELASLADNGRFVAIADRSEQLRVIDLESGSADTLEGHTDELCCVSFAAGSRLLVTGDYDNRVRLWPFSSEGPAFGAAITERVADVQRRPPPESAPPESESLASERPTAEPLKSPHRSLLAVGLPDPTKPSS